MDPAPSTLTPGPRAVVYNAADWARSPRARAHAWAMARVGYQVEVYTHGSVAGADKAAYASFPLEKASPARLRKNPPRLFLATTPPIWPGYRALWSLRGAPSSTVLDWHNLGYTRMALDRGSRRPGALLYGGLERWARPPAAVHLAVSHALAGFLATRWRVRPVRVLHDHPVDPSAAAAGSPSFDRRALLEWAGLDARWADASWLACPNSWSRDERLDWIPAIARELDAGLGGSRRVVFWATGRGKLLEAFRERRDRLSLNRVRIPTPWLPDEAYRALLRACDAGLCLHASSSGLDLPIKLVDFRAAGLPALVYRYGEVLREQFVEGRDGRGFQSPAELTELIVAMAGGRLKFGPVPPGEPWLDAWKRTLEDLLP